MPLVVVVKLVILPWHVIFFDRPLRLFLFVTFILVLLMYVASSSCLRSKFLVSSVLEVVVPSSLASSVCTLVLQRAPILNCCVLCVVTVCSHWIVPCCLFHSYFSIQFSRAQELGSSVVCCLRIRVLHLLLRSSPLYVIVLASCCSEAV